MAAEKYVRPQKHNSWFNVIPVKEFNKSNLKEFPFLDSFVTIKAYGNNSFKVLYEGSQHLLVELHFGFICVWFGDNLEVPDWPFPILFKESFGHEFFIGKPRIFKDTNLLDLIENNGDPIHFKTVHKWLEVNLSEHVYTPTKYSLRMRGKVQYARSANSAFKRYLSKFLPITEYEQELAFHGPGFGSGNIVTDPNLKAHLILAFMPVGDNDLRLHLAASVNVESFPAWIKLLFKLIPFVSLHDFVSWALVKAGADDTDGDYRIWHTKRSLKEPKLLSGEKNIVKIREWMANFYLKDFKQPEQRIKLEQDKSWSVLANESQIQLGKVNSFNLEGEDLVAIKTDQGELRVFEAHCPHQGAHLGFGGEVKDNCISCPFHKFYFNVDGQYVGAKPNGTVKNDMALTLVSSRVSEGRIEVFL
jgi:phenylpropionate dioxygenase-like ring-hydroxylating dioxygenase large terminal subunit